MTKNYVDYQFPGQLDIVMKPEQTLNFDLPFGTGIERKLAWHLGQLFDHGHGEESFFKIPIPAKNRENLTLRKNINKTQKPMPSTIL